MDRIEVQCYSGHRGEETPRRFRLTTHWIEVHELLDCWLAPGHRYFKVLGSDGDTYILRHDSYGDTWELTFFSKG